MVAARNLDITTGESTLEKRQRRMALTLSAEAEAAIFDLADAIGKPAATIAAELLAEMAPQLHDVAKIARLSQQGKKNAAKRALVHMVGDGMASILQEQLPLPGTKGKR